MPSSKTKESKRDGLEDKIGESQQRASQRAIDPRLLYAVKFSTTDDVEQGMGYIIDNCKGSPILRGDVACVWGEVLRELDRREIKYRYVVVRRRSKGDILRYLDSKK